MSEAAKGIAAMALACTIWGLSPLFYKLLQEVPPLEVLAHRTLWSLVVFGIVLALQRRLAELRRALDTPRKLGLTAAAAAMISVNWFLFILAIQIDRVTETSLGYYIYPLVAVAIGAVVLHERLAPAQWLAVGLAAVAVVVLTVGLGVAPWISLALAVSFGIYGLLKRWVEAGPVVSVSAEVTLFLPLSLAYLIWIGTEGAFAADASVSVLLILSGQLTAIPLILFSYAAKRAAMSTIGLIQYLNPTLQFFCAAAVLGEAMTLWHGIAFPMIWTALALFSFVSLKRPVSRVP